MKRLRAKKKCGKCEYWAGSPYVHCVLGSPIINFTNVKNDKKVFESEPAKKEDCTNKRQLKLNEVNQAR